MDLFIAGLPRAGTTMLANLLTQPPDRLVLIEPGLTRGDPGAKVPPQFEGFDCGDDARDPAPREGESSHARFWRLWGPTIRGLRSWGVKEVNPVGYDDLLARYEPRRVIVLVRDVRDAALSLAEKLDRSPVVGGQTLEWATQRLIDAAHAIMRTHASMPAARVRVVRYEDLVSDAGERAAIESWLDWPMTGQPDRHLECFGRGWEIGRHAGRVSDLSVSRRDRETSVEAARYADEVADRLGDFQRAFGYDARRVA
jgi:hypothetical protein